MKKQIVLIGSFLICISILQSCAQKQSVSKIELRLSAFGVESDDFPSIDGYIDFVNKSSNCTKSYYNPAYKESAYQFSQEEIINILQLLQGSDLDKLKKEYSNNRSDQPTSTLIIYTGKGIYTIKDYGLMGDRPLPELYKMVYKI